MLTALFHDLGKAFTTTKNAKGYWTSLGHDLSSLRLVEKYKDWIENMGGNYEMIHFLVKNHMRIHQIEEMKPTKQKELRTHIWYPELVQFSEFDNMIKDRNNGIE